MFHRITDAIVHPNNVANFGPLQRKVIDAGAPPTRRIKLVDF